MDIKFEEVQRVKSLATTLGHPVRYNIVNYLIANGTSNVTSIYTDLQLRQPDVSHHLSRLRAINVVSAERDGKEIFYTVDRDEYDRLINIIKQI